MQRKAPVAQDQKVAAKRQIMFLRAILFEMAEKFARDEGDPSDLNVVRIFLHLKKREVGILSKLIEHGAEAENPTESRSPAAA